MQRRTRYYVALVIGGLMIGIGLWIVASTLLLRRPPVTSSTALDMGFAAFFMLRGAMNLHRARTADRMAAAARNEDAARG